MGFMEIFDGAVKILNGCIEAYLESPQCKKMVKMAEQRKAAEIARTTGINGLRCKINKAYTMYSDTHVCEGTVENIGRSTYRHIEVQVVFKDDTGKVVDKKEAYTPFNIELAPGESMSFRASSTANNIHRAYASVSRFDEVDRGCYEEDDDI